MKCLRCGWCCTYLAVVLPDGSLHGEAPPQQCKFLTFDGLQAICSVHGQDSKIKDGSSVWVTPWGETPCGEYQSHGGSQPCRMGLWIMQHGGLIKWMSQNRRSP